MSSHSLENFLKSCWQLSDFRLIGRYEPHPNGKIAWFNDLRSVSGDLLYLSDNNSFGLKAGKVSAVTYASSQLVLGEYYQFAAQVNDKEHERAKTPLRVNPQPFDKVSAKIQKRIDNEQLIKDIFRQNGATFKDAKNLASSLRNFQIELYTETERFIFELLQNADDFPVDGHEVSVNFTVLTENLLVCHTGRPFDERDVKSICSIGDSSKAQNKSATGYKGIGFKSVFTHSKRVFIASGGYSFCFNQDHPTYRTFDKMYPGVKDGFTEDQTLYVGPDNVPWQIKPIWRERYLFPKEVKLRDDFYKSNVSFCLEFGVENILSFRDKAYEFFQESRFLLFLRNINHVEFNAGSNNWYVRRQTENDIVCLTSETDEKTYITYRVPEIDLTNQRNMLNGIGNIPKKLLDSPYLNIAFGAMLENDSIVPERDSVLFTYLPTKDHTYNFPFLVNADFVTNSSRELIQPDNKWNELVFEQIGFQNFKWITYLFQAYPNLRSSIYRIIPKRQTGTTPVCQAFNRGFDKAIQELSFVLNQHGHLQRLDETLIDRTGLSELLRNEFGSITGQEKVPISSTVFVDPIQALSEEHELGVVFDFTALQALIRTEPFQNWIRQPTQNADFLQLLVDKNWLEDCKNQLIFLNQHGELCPAQELYTDFGDDWSLLSWLSLSYLHPDVRATVSAVEYVMNDYKPVNFIKAELLGKKGEVDALLAQEDNNLSFYRYLFKHRKTLPSDGYFSDNQLFYFKVWGNWDGREYVSSFQDKLSLYVHHPVLADLLDKGIFPVNHFCLISPDFAENAETQEEWAEFWGRFNVKQYKSAEFLDREILKAIGKLNAHYKIYDPFETEPSESYRQRQQASVALWEYMEKNLPNLPEASQKEAYKTLKKLVVFTTENGPAVALGECFLSEQYTSNSTIEVVAKEQGLNLTFISGCYLVAGHLSVKIWKGLFDKCGVKQNQYEVVAEHLIPSLARFIGDSLLEATRSIVKHWPHLEKRPTVLNQLETGLKVKTVDGQWIPVKEAILGHHYTKSALLDTILPLVQVPNQISSEYATENQADKWRTFFDVLGAINLTTRDKVIIHKIKYLLGNQTTLNTTESSPLLVNDLLTLHKKEELKTHYADLSELLLLVNGPKMLPAWQCHLASAYKPALDLEQLLPEAARPAIFVSPAYQTKGENHEELKAFLGKISVAEDFRVDPSHRKEDLPYSYRSYISEHNQTIRKTPQTASNKHSVSPWYTLLYIDLLQYSSVATAFWQKITIENSFRGAVKDTVRYNYGPSYNSSTWVINGIVHTLLTTNSIPTRAGTCAKPSTLYSLKFAEYIADSSLLPAVDLRNVNVENKPLEEWLGIQQLLALRFCLLRITAIQNLEKLRKEEIWKRITEILKATPHLPDAEDRAELQRFKETGKLPNQQGEWRPISELHYIGDVFKLGINKWAELIHDSLKDLSGAFGVRKLTEADFKFTPKNKDEFAGRWFKTVLSDRLKYIAFAEDQDNWQQLSNDYRNIINGFTFYQTARIAFAFSDGEATIQSTEKNFYHKPDTAEIYYVGNWDGSRAVDLFPFIHGKLNPGISEKELKDLLIDTESQVREFFTERGFELPSGWQPAPVIPVSTVQTTASPVAVHTENSTPVHEEPAVANEPLVYPPIDDPTKKLALTKGLGAVEQQQKNYEAKQVVLNKLRVSDEYDASGCLVGDYEITGVRCRKSGDLLRFYISSVVSGALYLWPARWLDLKKPDTRLALVINDRVARIVSSQEELLGYYNRPILRVESKADIQDDLTDVARLTKHSNTWQFIFYNAVDEYDGKPGSSLSLPNNPQLDVDDDQPDNL